MKIIIYYCLFIFIFSYSAIASAWGPTGHRITGKIAENFLTNRAKKAINTLVGSNSLARIANWPDQIKSRPKEYGHTFEWHYMTWPKEIYRPYKGPGRLIEAIKKQRARLKSTKTSIHLKREALKFIVHLVGDLHMPFHVGNGRDRGGHYCRVFFHGKKTNLHVLWDEKLIEFTRLSYTEYSEFILNAHRDMILKHQNDKTSKVLDWAKESKILRKKVYPAKYPLRKYCRKGEGASAKKWPRLGYKYSDQHKLSLEKRLLLAGMRIAKVLNESL